ncbi:MAG: hypothetical protein CVU18_04385 [Betaproteobacteria bacterium HGW-Betaproteobacteria-12]|nr:MAG: hypothetical protein CVU18_04385 [Betaproteobacteria bacterium HGW-Betaproteobacteria-12]
MTDKQGIFLSISIGGNIPESFLPAYDEKKDEPGPWVRKGIPFPDRSVEGIVCHNFVERLTQTELLIFLRECRRILSPGGVIRIITVDLAALVDSYVSGDWQTASQQANTTKWINNRGEYLNTFMRRWGRTWICDEVELARLGEFAGLEPARHSPTGVSDFFQESGLPSEPANALALELRKRIDEISEQPLVSIVIPAYRPDFLGACLDSALAQTHQNLEIVISDDSSTPDVERIVGEYATRHPRIVYARNPKPLGEARNLTNAIHMATGEFVKPLYDDDLLLDDCLEKLLAALQQTPDARMASGRRLPIDEQGQLLDEAIVGPPLTGQSTRLPGAAVIAQIAESGFNNLGEPTVMLFRRKDLLAIPEPDVMSLFGRRFVGIGDIGLALHMLSRGELAYVAEPIACFRLHPGQNQRRPGFRNWVAGTWVYFREQAQRLGLSMDTLTGEARIPKEASRQVGMDDYYRAWLQLREFIAEDIQLIEAGIRQLGSDPPSFQVILRLRPGDEALLADTLESLNMQFYGNWRADIVSTLDAPDGMENIPNLGWQVLANPDQAKSALDFLILSQGCDYVIEVPVGTRLDPLCLWRVAIERESAPDAVAFYTDDDLVAPDGTRTSPRFKTNLDADSIRSADLIGTLFVNRKILRQVGGVASDTGCAWYDLLLRLLESNAPEHIRHLSDVLVSLPEQSESNPLACMEALARHLTRLDEDCDVMPTSDRTWRVVYHLNELPGISILLRSLNALEFLKPCVDSILAKTDYPAFELVIAFDLGHADNELLAWLQELASRAERPCKIIDVGTSPFAAAINLAASEASGDILLLLKEETQILQENWLQQLLGHCLRPGVGAVMPRLVQPHSGLIENVGYTFGLGGIIGSPHKGQLKFSDDGELHGLQTTRQVVAAPASCLMLRKSHFLEIGGFDAAELAGLHAEIDLSLKLRQRDLSIVCTPAVTVVSYQELNQSLPPDPSREAARQLADDGSLKVLQRRWRKAMVSDDLRSPNISLASAAHLPEIDYLPSWRYMPTKLPKLFARTLANGQGSYRVSMPMRAARAAGLIQGCESFPIDQAMNPIEIARLGADSYIVQNFLTDIRLAELHQYRRFSPEAFIVYACDDLMTDMPLKSHFRHLVPADARSRFKIALRDCDRLVVSTDYLAEVYCHFIDDIRIVPNRLQRGTWLTLETNQRTGPRPRIGWAGGSGHQADLELLKPVIEATRDDADWVFFGMCPEEIRHLVHEYHPLVPLNAYPAKLAALNLDLAVAPLEDHPFNRGKSNLRLLEYGALGLPVVCTDIDPYRNSPAYRVPNDPSAWIEAVRERIHDPEATTREGLAMKDWVGRNFILEDHPADWVRAHLPD